MTNGSYDWDAFANVNILQQSNKREDQERLCRLLSTFATENGWKICASFLLRDQSFDQLYHEKTDLGIQDYFCFRAIEEYIVNFYKTENDEKTLESMRLFILQYIESYVYDKHGKTASYLRNKCIDIATKVALIDYPKRWTNLFKNIMYVVHTSNSDILKGLNIDSITSYGEASFEFLFKFLINWDAEVCAKEAQTPQLLERNTSIKDWMRNNDVKEIMEIVSFVIIEINMKKPKLLKKALKVTSLYISWIDVFYVVNDSMIDNIIRAVHLSSEDTVRSASLDCLIGILNKGMQSAYKLDLISYLCQKLANSNVWSGGISEAKSLPDNGGEDFGCDEDELDNCFYVTLASLNSTIGSQLIDVCKSFREAKDNSKMALCMTMIYESVANALEFASCKNNDVAETNFQFLQNFVTLLKSIYKCDAKKSRRSNPSSKSASVVAPTVANVPMNEQESELLKKTLVVLYHKIQYPGWYRFDNEEEKEGDFLEMRKQLMIILTNTIQLDSQIVLKTLLEFTKYTVNHNNNLSFQEIEACLSMIYHLGEAIKSIKGDYFCRECEVANYMTEIMKLLCVSDIGRHSNCEVRITFFEILFRYEKYFNHNGECLLDIIGLFLSEHGLKSSQMKAVTRCVYILSRLIKTHKGKLGPAAIEVLQEIASILQASFVNNSLLTTDSSSTVTAYSYLYESAAQLVVGLQELSDKPHIFQSLIQPICGQLPALCDEWARSALAAVHTDDETVNTTNPLNIKANRAAGSIHSAMTYITYSLRAFSSAAHSLHESGCLAVYTDALDRLLSSLDEVVTVRCPQPLAPGRARINSGLRSLLHTLCKCAQGDPTASSAVLARLPTSVSLFSLQASPLLATELADVIPLYMQAMHAFRTTSLPFLSSSLWPLLSLAFQVLKAEPANTDLARLTLQMLVSDLSLVLQALGPDRAYETCTGALHIISHNENEPIDPILVKTCLAIFHKFLTQFHELNCASKETILVQIVYQQLLPTSILLPCSVHFNIDDPQFCIALNEIAIFQRMLYLHGGNQFIQYLQSECLPQLNFSADLISQYCHAITLVDKDFQAFLKNIYMQAKSR